MSQEKEHGSRIEVTITPKMEGRIVFYNNGKPLLQPPATPSNMSASEALIRARVFQECTVGYSLKINNPS
ncbi:MAG: hypothetical protein NTV24_02410 [Candidatus Woesebacteria bacterium]|nr:hypothetical protein [Candidatus Woesebacteria bacterium]